MGSPHSCALQLAHWPRCQGIPASRNKHLKQNNNNNKTKLDSLKETFHVKQAVLRIEPVQGLLNREPPVMAILGLLLGVHLELLGDEPCHAGAGWVETIDCWLQLWLTMTLNRWQWSKDMSNYLSKPKCFTAGWASSRKQWSCVTFQPPSHLKTKKKWFLQQLLNYCLMLFEILSPRLNCAIWKGHFHTGHLEELLHPGQFICPNLSELLYLILVLWIMSFESQLSVMENRWSGAKVPRYFWSSSSVSLLPLSASRPLDVWATYPAMATQDRKAN